MKKRIPLFPSKKTKPNDVSRDIIDIQFRQINNVVTLMQRLQINDEDKQRLKYYISEMNKLIS